MFWMWNFIQREMNKKKNRRKRKYYILDFLQKILFGACVHCNSHCEWLNILYLALNRFYIIILRSKGTTYSIGTLTVVFALLFFLSFFSSLSIFFEAHRNLLSTQPTMIKHTSLLLKLFHFFHFFVMLFPSPIFFLFCFSSC